MKSALYTEKKPPFVYQYFIISTFTTNPLSDQDDVLARLVNCFIKGLNDNIRLPSLLVVIPDHDLLNYVAQYTMGNSTQEQLLERVFRWAIQWIAGQLDHAIEIRKDYLQIRNTG